MSREKLALDIDEVMFPFVGGFSKWHNGLYGTRLRMEDFHSYELEEVIGGSVPEVMGKVHSFLEQEHRHIGVTPIDEAQDGVARLAAVYDITAVTARHPSFRDITDEYLATHFEGCFKELILIGHHANMETVRTKAEVCQEIGAVSLIDDSIAHVSACSEVGIPAVLFGNYSWNQCSEDQLPPLVSRCPDWPAVTEHFNV